MPRALIALVLAVALMPAVKAARKPVVAADLSGTWSGSIAIPKDGKKEKNPLHAVLKQDGALLSGTVGPSPDAQVTISHGRVENTKFGTSTIFELAGKGFVMRFELRLEEGVLKGVARIDGEKATAPVELRAAQD